MKQVGVLIVTYNRLNLLQEEIDSIRNQTFRDFDIIVVNNCSVDNTKEWLDAQDDIYAINIEPENIGPARAFAQGMKYIAEAGYMYCWLMDDDVECKPTALAELYEAYRLNSDMGFACSKVIGIDGFPMNVPNIDTRLSENGYSNYGDMLEYGMLRVIDCTFVSMFIPTDVICKVGLPLKEFYNWGVDTEYSMRISKHHPCYSVNKSIVIHKRTIQKALTFEQEKDPVRIGYYRDRFRNMIYIYSVYEKNIFKKYMMAYLKSTIKCFLSLRIPLFVTKVKALKDFYRLDVRIDYPQK